MFSSSITISYRASALLPTRLHCQDDLLPPESCSDIFQQMCSPELRHSAFAWLRRLRRRGVGAGFWFSTCIVCRATTQSNTILYLLLNPALISVKSFGRVMEFVVVNMDHAVLPCFAAVAKDTSVRMSSCPRDISTCERSHCTLDCLCIGQSDA